jgi:membrane peptidoglycan carboxypeptidase
MKIVKKIIKFSFLFIIIFLIFSFAFFGYSKLSLKVEIKNANNITLYDKDNNSFFVGNGTSAWINLEDISKYLIDATISTEDKNFYKHIGFDIPRIIKAGFKNITSGKTLEGASTISQQYVKNLFLDFDKTWERKWNEMWLTLNIEMHYSKDEILEGYLNTINYGHGMYGVENASLFYFGKSAKDLTLAESSMLVGIPKSPSNYSPINNYELAKKRQYMVLNSMVKNDYITETEKEEAFNEELTIVGKKNNINLSTVMYYQDAVFKELQELDIPKSFLDDLDELIKAAYKNSDDIKDRVAKIVTTYKVDKERVGK